MAKFSYTTLLLLQFLLQSISWEAASAGSSSPVPEYFIPCLLNHSQSSHPISSAIFTPNNSSFPSVLRNYIRNLRFNTPETRKPFLIITALHESHIRVAICAQEHNLQMKIRSGGHDYEGVSYVSQVPFFVLDMFHLRSVKVDIEKETAWVQAGATLGEIYYGIWKKSKVHGLAGGVCPTVGAGGTITGGGYGNMMRKYGLVVDNLLDAQIIDVNGRLLDRKSMGEDLFWAISGGGGASFGVVLSYKIKLSRVPKIVTVFRVNKTLEQNVSFIASRWQQVADKIDEDLFIRLTLGVVNKTGYKTGNATFLGMFLGDSERLLSVMNKSFPELGLEKSDCKEMSWVQSVLFWYKLGTSEHVLLRRKPKSLVNLKRKSDYLKKPISKDGLESIWHRMMELDDKLELTFNPYGGKMAEIPPNATAFPHRAGNIAKIQYAVDWHQKGTVAADYYINLTRMLYTYMTPFVSKNPREAYLNYRDLDLGINHNRKGSYFEGRRYGIKYFKGNFNRLVEIKTKVDPHNFFRNEQSIPVLPMNY